MTRTLSGLVVAALLLPATALAQVEGAPQPEYRIDENGKRVRVIYRAIEHIDIDPTTIEADAKKPAGAWISGRIASDFEKMIPERVNFKADLAESLHRLDR